ncbi:MAG TPA: double-strand break repair helicase AddA, partial [Tianweitania sediminis]|nr:double-strand break repair helicase AddA [Tianweitania sediminis]
KIQTIHAFCEALLHQFPLEANIAGHFELLEGQAAEALVAEARRRLLLGTAGETDPELTAAFATVLARGGEWGLEQLLDEIVAKRDDLAAAIADLDRFELREEHGFRPEDSAESLALDVWPDAFFDAALAETVLDCAAGKVKATSFAEGLKAVCASSSAQAFSAICQLFLTAKGEPRKATHIAVKEVVSRIPGFADHYDRMASALLACTDRIALLEMVQATEAALVIAERLIGSYFRMKHARGFLDFEDLIRRTIALLAREDAGPWIRYRLDQGIDHILVDEAQDTSPQQWAVIRQLSDEFFSGQGARPNTERTIFAVGDQKQSIYSFQGAEPESFEWNRQSFKRDVEAAERSFNTIKLERSFRSTEDVLSAVDAVFSDPERRRGLSPDGDSFQHRPIRLEPGFVEVWSSVGQTVAPEPDDWTLSIDHAKAPAVQVAERIADRIQTWLKDKEMLPGTGRPVSPGDVMVLVRKRDSFIHALTRALKNRNIAVAGADRLSLPAHIAVKDLVALGRIVLQPDDDLSLAALLKSPIFGLDDNALFAFAYKRGEGVSLYTSLRRAAADDLVLHSVVQQLDSWRKEAGFRPAFEFFAGLLGGGGVRQKMISRLGHEAGEIIDEFQSFLLAAEQAGAVDLEAVLALLSQSGPDIKREMDQTRNEVRIMTVHAAKGLEAPVVFLVDSGGEPFSASHLPRLLPYEASSGRKRFLWRASKDLSNAATRQIEAVLRAKAEDEYRRLLYVGMTRAEDRLVVCGYHGKNPPRGATWLSMVQAGLSDLPDTTTLHDEEQGTVLRYQVSRGAAVEPEQRDLSSPPALPPVPAFLRELAPPPTRLPRPLAPSRASALIETEPRDAPVDRSPVLDEDTQPGFAILRGTAIHRLLQLLPDLPREDQRSAATRYLGRIGG